MSLMAKLIKKAKAIAKEKGKAKDKGCTDCNGTGLKDAHNLCSVCVGTGVVPSK